MQSAYIIDAVMLAAVLEADLGPHRKIGALRIIRPLLVAATIVPLYLKATVTSGTGLTLEIALTAAGIVLGLAATALLAVYRSPKTGRPVSRAGTGYAALWIAVIGARATFTYGSQHWFSTQLGHWMAANAVSSAAITDALIFMALAMLLTRTIGLVGRTLNLDSMAETAAGSRAVALDPAA